MGLIERLFRLAECVGEDIETISISIPMFIGVYASKSVYNGEGFSLVRGSWTSDNITDNIQFYRKYRLEIGGVDIPEKDICEKLYGKLTEKIAEKEINAKEHQEDIREAIWQFAGVSK